MLAFRKELDALRVSGSDEILLRAASCELADNDATTRHHILEQDKLFQPLDSGF